ncbi:unnamed protein product [Plutella xylostella]|uniref:(diamondback moth) hypothetical protein n=1 Tax=Plutella xylostella TaxID=51655 RepID=A0A8S4FX96_PLUXY|nr:unnamed protein product [Plutella xylostella]
MTNSGEKQEKSTNMTVDPIEKAIGRFGKYQICILILIGFGRLPTEFQITNVVFILPSVDYTCRDDVTSNLTNVCPCNQPEYDQSIMTSSAVTTWDLICGRKNLASVAQSMLQVGILLGSLGFGYISDKCGRKTAVHLSLSVSVISVATSAAVPEFWMFCVLRVCCGVGVGGTMVCCYVLLIEMSGKSFRLYLMALIEASYILGYFLISVIAYFVRDWRHLQLVTSLPWVFVFLYYWAVPESPRWLITAGKKQEAIGLLTRIAKKNNMPTENIEEIVNEIENESLNAAQEQKGSYLDLFRTPKIRMCTIISALVWFSVTFVFYGVNQYIGRLDGNMHLNVMLSSLALAPGLVITIIGALLFSRRVSIVLSFCISAFSLLLFLVIPKSMAVLSVACAIVGQTGIFTAFIQVYLFSAEIFPTVIRNSALGFGSTMARFGGLIAPFVVNIGVEWISIVLFSSFALLAAILCCFLPETKDIVLMNSIKQMEKTNDTPEKTTDKVLK